MRVDRRAGAEQGGDGRRHVDEPGIFGDGARPDACTRDQERHPHLQGAAVTAPRHPFFGLREPEAPRLPGLDDEVTELVARAQGFEVRRVEDPGDLGQFFEDPPYLRPLLGRRRPAPQGDVHDPARALDDDDLGVG